MHTRRALPPPDARTALVTQRVYNEYADKVTAQLPPKFRCSIFVSSSLSNTAYLTALSVGRLGCRCTHRALSRHARVCLTLLQTAITLYSSFLIIALDCVRCIQLQDIDGSASRWYYDGSQDCHDYRYRLTCTHLHASFT